jgi:endonuclease/exonuclease/phosphatase (EEP) superfamily protein YafD
MVTVTVLLMAQPNVPIVKTMVNYVEWIALGFTLLGLGMIAFKQRRIMLASMLCAATICLYFDQMLPEQPIIRHTLNQTVAVPSRYEVRIGHCNLSNHNGQPQAMLEYMRAQNTDVLTLLEYNQGWDSLIELTLMSTYPYRIFRPDLGYKGMAILSRLPVTLHDSMDVQDARMLGVMLDLDNGLGSLACYLNMIPLSTSVTGEASRTEFLNKIRTRILQHEETPTLVLGEFSDPNWNNALRDFRTECNLYNSRAGLMLISPCAQFPNFRVPSEHIFYSTSLECAEFLPLGNPYSDYIGLTGTYRIKQTTHAVQ